MILTASWFCFLKESLTRATSAIFPPHSNIPHQGQLWAAGAHCAVSSQLRVYWHHTGGLKSALVDIFTLWQSASESANELGLLDFTLFFVFVYLFFGKPVMKPLAGWCPGLRSPQTWNLPNCMYLSDSTIISRFCITPKSSFLVVASSHIPKCPAEELGCSLTKGQSEAESDRLLSWIFPS